MPRTFDNGGKCWVVLDILQIIEVFVLELDSDCTQSTLL